MRRGIAIGLVLTGFLVVAPAANAYIFWSSYNSGNGTVGRASLDGSDVRPNLVTGIYYGQGVGTDGNYVYWGESGSNPNLAQIGRATIDGSGANHAFQSAATYCGVFDVVVTSTDLYWLKNDCSGLSINTRIDKAPISGGNYSEPGAGSYICGFDVDANYVYWSEGHYIARAPNVYPPQLPDKTWLDVGATAAPCAVAVDSGHVYWTQDLGAPTYRGTNIGRANIDGNPASVNNSFITGGSFTSAAGLAVDGGFIYWTNQAAVGDLTVTGSIGRASIDGTGVSQSFIPNLFNPNSIDVDSAGPGGSSTLSSPPLITGVSTSNGTFAPGGGSTPIHARIATLARTSKKTVPRGTVFSYRLDQDAQVTIAIQRIKGGRLLKGKCKKPKKSLAKKPKCDLTVATLFRDGKAGLNKVPFTGRIKGKALAPGSYRAVFTATGPGGKSKSASVGFRIVRP